MMQTSLQKALSTMNLGQIGLLCGNASAGKAKMVCPRDVQKFCACASPYTTRANICVDTYLRDTFYITTIFIKKNIRGFFINKSSDVHYFFAAMCQHISERYFFIASERFNFSLPCLHT